MKGQYVISAATIAAATLVSWYLFRAETYWAPSILYLFLVTILGGFLGRGPTILAAGLSALAWDFLFIPPRFTLHVERWEDALILITYAAIAGVTSLYTWRLRQSRALAEEGTRLANEARASEELHRIIFNSMSHEMRSPLTAIMGASSALYLIGDGEIVRPEDRRTLLQEIIRSSVRLSRLVDNFLDVSRLEAGRMKLKIQEFDLRSTVHDVLHRLREELASHDVTLDIPEVPVMVSGDPGLLFQSIFCVLHNASQYTPAGTKIHIRLLPVWPDRSVTLEISDNGPGIGDTPAERLFEKFFRVPGAMPGGAGLGLGLARGILELHGGSLRAEAPESGGLVFFFDFPSQPSGAGAA